MTISTIWEPVLDAAEGSGGSGSRGRGARRSSSIIAGRRPARKPDDKPEADEKPASSRRSAADKPDAKADDNDSADRPRAPRRRRRAAPRGEGSRDEESNEASDKQSNDEDDAPRSRSRRSPSRTSSRSASRSTKAEPDDAVAASEEPEAAATPEEPVAEDDATEAPAAAAVAAPARRAPIRATPSSNGDASGDLDSLRSLVEHQGSVLNELRAGLLTLGEQLDRAATKPRMGVFVDVPNLMYGQEPDEKPVNMGKLLDFLRQGRDIVRATAYSPVSDNPSEPLEQQKFVAPFVPYEYRIVTKPLKRFADGSIKGNFDVEMAIDMLTMADRLDVIAIVSGDADFARAVEVVQTRGVRVEVVAFARSSSLEMRSLADRYVELGAVIKQLV